MTRTAMGSGLVAAALGGFLADLVHLPLAWVIGSMLGVGVLSLLSGQRHQQPAHLRRSAQGCIGVALGLYFTPEVWQQLGGLLPWIVLGALTALTLSVLSAPVLQRWAKVEGPTAIYAVALGASAEMSLQGQRAGADAAAVASAHSLRIILVTTSATALAWVLGEPLTWAPPTAADLPWRVWMPMLGVAAVVAVVLYRARLPNPWLLGPLVVAALWASQGQIARLPEWITVAAQVLIGWALGQHLTRSFFVRAPRWLVCSGGVTLGILTVCLGVAVLIAMGSGLPVMTCFIAMAPGGMAEMGVIAKSFGLGAPVVTAFHLMRIVMTIFCTQWLAQWMMRTGWVQRQAPAD
jgi:membrane AbrB-like protein